MKKLLFLLIISCVSFSQDFEIPKFIDFSGIERLQKYEEEEGNRILEEEGYYYYPELYNSRANPIAVLGWGDNTYLAYIKDNSVDDFTCGTSIVIQNMVSDKIIDSFLLWGFDGSEENVENLLNPDSDLESTWDSKQYAIREFLNKYHIRQSEIFFNRSHYIFGDSKSPGLYDNETHILIGREYLDFNNQPLFQLLIFDFENKLYKELLNLEIDPYENDPYSDHYRSYFNIEGWFFSPDKTRIVIVLVENSYGFEGERDLFVSFIGCSLKPKTFK